MKDSMKQAVVTAPGTLAFRQVPLPRVEPGQVLIKVFRIGVCGSDVHVWHGLHPYTTFPVVQGHEVSGEVVRPGEGVTEFQEGDRVCLQPQITCGQCYSCLQGNYHICDSLKVMGFQTTGAASEYFAAPASRLLLLPREISLDAGALVEPLAVACHAIARGGGVKGKRVLVLGAGPIGSLIAQAAAGLGARDTGVTDLIPFRLDKARQCGVEKTILVSGGSLEESVTKIASFGPADVIFECVGAQSSMAQGVAAARKGSDIIVVGVFGKKPQVDLGLVQDRELTLKGTLMYQKSDYLTAIDLLQRKLVDAEGLITHRFDFDHYPKAYACIDQKKEETMKIIIDMERKA